MGDSFVGLQARLMSQALRKLTGAVSRSNTALVFTNQLREKIGVMFGNPETTPGGRALKFYASIRMDIRRIETLKNGTDAFGSRTRVKVVKNKVASPFRIAEFDILYNEGISREGGLLDVGIASGVLSKTGAWFNYGDTRLGNGREAAREFLKANPAGRCDRGRDPRPGGVHHHRRRRDCARVGVRDPGLTGWPRVASHPSRPANPGPADAEQAFEIAGRFLGTRPRSRWEVEQRLRRSGTTDEVWTVTLERLERIGFVDDEAFARWWVEQRDQHAPRDGWRSRPSFERSGFRPRSLPGCARWRTGSSPPPTTSERPPRSSVT